MTGTRAGALQRLLAPRHVAFVGGERAAVALRQCRDLGFTGALWPVHPSRDALEGLRCYPDVAALPEAPDAALVAVPAAASVRVVGGLSARGAGGVVCHASGFAESGSAGRELEQQLVEAADGMALVGPNCMGVLNYLDRVALWPDQHGGQPVDRGVGVITQSGNLAQNLTMQQRSLPLAQLAAVGNAAVTDVPQLIEAMLADPRISAIGLHLEGVRDVAALSRAALSALRGGVPIVVLKAGSSELGARAGLSHTASLAGADELWAAMFARHGMARVHDVSTFVETLKLLHVHGPLPGRGIASASCSGGEAALVADLAHRHHVGMPSLPSRTEARLRDVLGPSVAVGNPLDYHTYVWGDPLAQEACFHALLGSGLDLHILVLDVPRPPADSDAWWGTLEAFARAHRATRAPAAVLSTLPEGLPEAARTWLLDQGIAPLQGTADGLRAVAAATGIAVARNHAADIPAVTGASPTAPRSGCVVDEWTGKQALAAQGVPVPVGATTDAAHAVATARRIGFPVVVKALAPGLAHKSDVGAVRLNLRSADDVAHAVADLAPLANSFLVERMVPGTVAELVVAVRRDPLFGPALTLGAGGTLVEVLRDTVVLLLPVTADAVRAALRRLRTWPLLDGARGAPSGDVEAVVRTVSALADYVQSAPDVAEVEVNPLLVLPQGQGVVAVDVLLRGTVPSAHATDRGAPPRAATEEGACR
ncbi:MAG TPA: acetate--CoA ligase family protein [Segeticoccus sp.]|uniref:acetate--CoA ligase family protein n=1 Tax=Segeticoccus sp. TaxID=2706531 RepID=UPI002D7E4A9D|nr:acetate--CoA ligase family protein [Segeticoccus sp.]HET8599913.1 acetate--CoA ligase family protein [Segeticoccus sp.]